MPERGSTPSLIAANNQRYIQPDMAARLLTVWFKGQFKFGVLFVLFGGCWFSLASTRPVVMPGNKKTVRTNQPAGDQCLTQGIGKTCGRPY
jgi:hypothetical protein